MSCSSCRVRGQKNKLTDMQVLHILQLKKKLGKFRPTRSSLYLLCSQEKEKNSFLFFPFHCQSVRLCNPKDCSPLGSSVHGISQETVLEWVAISYSRGSSLPRDRACISCISRWILLSLNHQGNPESNTPELMYKFLAFSKDVAL